MSSPNKRKSSIPMIVDPSAPDHPASDEDSQPPKNVSSDSFSKPAATSPERKYGGYSPNKSFESEGENELLKTRSKKTVTKSVLRSSDRNAANVLSRSETPVYPTAMLCIGAFIFGVLTVNIWSKTASSENMEKPFDIFKTSLNELKANQFPSQSTVTWNRIEAHVNHMLESKSTYPTCILLLGSQSYWTNCLARRVASLLPPQTNSTAVVEGHKLKFHDGNKNKVHILESLKSSLYQDKVAILTDIHELSGMAAMALHGLCDESATNLASSLLFITAKSNDLPSDKDLGAAAESIFKGTWKNDLGEDILASLLSRITVIVAGVRPENSSPEWC